LHAATAHQAGKAIFLVMTTPIYRRVRAILLLGTASTAAAAWAQGAAPAPGASVRDLGWLCAIALAGVVVGLLARHRRPDAPVAPVPEPEPVPEPIVDEVVPDEPTPDVPGPILASLQTLNDDLALTTQRVQRYSSQREVQLQQWQRITAEVLRRVIPVLENLEPYLDDANPEVAELAQLTYGRLQTELATVGVTRIAPEPGDTVEWRLHQLDPASDGTPPYAITRLVSAGYLFQPRVSGAQEIVLKPAEVVATSADEDASDMEITVVTDDMEPPLPVLERDPVAEGE
jgi:molecular chaperone GrpE (heat shock protein)